MFDAPEFYTIGVYGSTEHQFFDKLVLNEIDTFIDIRQRRAVRGSKYSFVNSKKLQDRLKELGIKYLHILELAPTKEIRNLQKQVDKDSGVSKTNRIQLGQVFIETYTNQILEKYDFSELFILLRKMGTKKAILFCVEKDFEACHRSLVSNLLKQKYSKSINHL